MPHPDRCPGSRVREPRLVTEEEAPPVCELALEQGEMHAQLRIKLGDARAETREIHVREELAPILDELGGQLVVDGHGEARTGLEKAVAPQAERETQPCTAAWEQCRLGMTSLEFQGDAI